MGPLGYPEMVVIFLIILLLFGAKKLPQLARGVGKSMGEFKKAKDEFEHEITRAEDEVTTEADSEVTSAPKESTPREEEES
jgi:sec-independent protein translocase protein TatA